MGRTYDVKAREAAHKKSKEGLKLDVNEDNLDYYECRGYEQYYIYYYKTLHDYKKEGDEYVYSNKINGIGPNNKNKYEYFNRDMHRLYGETFVGKEIYEGDIDWGKY